MHRWLWAATAAFCLAAAAPGYAGDPLVLQLKWLPDAQFAGYFVAEARGFYRDAGLDVTIKPGGPDITPSQVLNSGGADVAVDWLASALAARDQGVPIVNIAQVFQHSGLQLTCRRDSGVRRPADLKGKTLGVWFAGNEYPFLAWMAKLGLTTSGDKPDTVLRQDSGVGLLLEGRAACISTMSYNEYWQVVDAGVKPSQLIVFRYDDEGVATLEDGLYVLSARLADPAMQDRLARFVRASVEGWRFAAATARQPEVMRILLRAGAADAADRRPAERMLREVAKLVANERHGLGYLEPASYERTVEILLSAAANPVIRGRPEGAWTHEVWDRAFPR